MLIVCLLSCSYLLGALPFGLWIAYRLKGIDIRDVGSGNIGSTNVGRVCGPVAGAVVMILDALKGLLPPIAATKLGLDSRFVILAALLAIVGHNFSVFLKFKGGKGISTSAGALFGASFSVGVIAAAIFTTSVLLLRWVSVGSILAAMSLPFAMHYFYPGDIYRLEFSIVACVMALFKHKSNIGRLLKGTEPRVSLTRRKSSPAEPSVPKSEDQDGADER